MSIAFVQYASAANAAVNTTITVNVPVGTANGHVMVLQVLKDGSVGFTAPTGWTQIGADSKHTYYWRVAAAEPASYTITYATGSGVRATAIIATYSGVDTTTPIADYSYASGSGITQTCGSLSVPDGPYVLIVGDELNRGSATFTPPTDYTLIAQVDTGGATSAHTAGALAYKVFSGTATGTAVWTSSVTANCETAHIALLPAGATPPASPEAGIFIDWDNDGFDTGTSISGALTRLMPASSSTADDNITPDVISVSWRRGASIDHVSAAGPGNATIVVKNGSNAVEPDKYNPDNTASTLYGKLVPGHPVWGGAIRTTAALSGSGDVAGFLSGRITEIVPMPVSGGNPTAEILVEDALGWYRRATASVTPSVARSQATFRGAILESIGEDVGRFVLDTESGMLPFSAVDTREALGVLEDLNRATATRHWISPANSKEDWYTYRTAGRTYKLASSADAAINADDVTDLSGYRVTNDTIVNEQRATVSPVAFSPVNATHWTSGQLPITVTTTLNVTIWVDFDDYVFDAAVNAVSSGGTLTTTLTNFGKAAKLELHAATAAVTITSLYITGRQLERLDNESVVSEDPASQLRYGTQSGSDISSDFIGQTGAAKGVTDFLIWKFANPLKRPTVTIAGKGALTWNYILDLDVFDIVTLTVDRLQVVSRRFEIIGLSGSIEPGAFWQVSYELQETPNQSAVTFFTVDTDLVNGAALIAPF